MTRAEQNKGIQKAEERAAIKRGMTVEEYRNYQRRKSYMDKLEYHQKMIAYYQEQIRKTF